MSDQNLKGDWKAEEIVSSRWANVIARIFSHIKPRSIKNGVCQVEDLGADLGSASTQFNTVYAKNYSSDGKIIDFSKIPSKPNQIISGGRNDEGLFDFLGTSSNSTLFLDGRKVNSKGVQDSFSITLDGKTYTIEDNTSLTLAIPLDTDKSSRSAKLVSATKEEFEFTTKEWYTDSEYGSKLGTANAPMILENPETGFDYGSSEPETFVFQVGAEYFEGTILKFGNRYRITDAFRAPFLDFATKDPISAPLNLDPISNKSIKVKRIKAAYIFIYVDPSDSTKLKLDFSLRKPKTQFHFPHNPKAGDFFLSTRSNTWFKRGSNWQPVPGCFFLATIAISNAKIEGFRIADPYHPVNQLTVTKPESHPSFELTTTLDSSGNPSELIFTKQNFVEFIDAYGVRHISSSGYRFLADQNPDPNFVPRTGLNFLYIDANSGNPLVSSASPFYVEHNNLFLHPYRENCICVAMCVLDKNQQKVVWQGSAGTPYHTPILTSIYPSINSLNEFTNMTLKPLNKMGQAGSGDYKLTKWDDNRKHPKLETGRKFKDSNFSPMKDARKSFFIVNFGLKVTFISTGRPITISYASDQVFTNPSSMDIPAALGWDNFTPKALDTTMLQIAENDFLHYRFITGIKNRYRPLNVGQTSEVAPQKSKGLFIMGNAKLYKSAQHEDNFGDRNYNIIENVLHLPIGLFEATVFFEGIDHINNGKLSIALQNIGLRATETV